MNSGYIFRGWDRDRKCWVPSSYWMIDPKQGPIWTRKFWAGESDMRANIHPQRFLGYYDGNNIPVFEGDWLLKKTLGGDIFEKAEDYKRDNLTNGNIEPYIEVTGNVFQPELPIEELEVSNQI